LTLILYPRVFTRDSLQLDLLLLTLLTLQTLLRHYYTLLAFYLTHYYYYTHGRHSYLTFTLRYLVKHYT